MGVFQYTMFAYVLTAVISFAVIGLIVLINKLMNNNVSSKHNG